MLRCHALAWSAAFVIGAVPLTFAQPPCTDIRFPRGARSTTVSGTVPAEGELCYTLATGSGQTARLQITNGHNVVLSVEGVADAQDDLTFRTRRRNYRIIVGQMFRTDTPEPFVLMVAVR